VCQVLDCAKDRLWFEHHSFASTEWPIINHVMAVVSEIAQIMDRDLYKTSFFRPANNAVIERAGEEFRKDSNNVNSHNSDI